jgi:hypothetical protein
VAKIQVRRTLHIPQKHLPERDRCPQKTPQCSMNHWFSVPAIQVRGTWNVMDMLSVDSINNTILVYGRLRRAAR